MVSRRRCFISTLPMYTFLLLGVNAFTTEVASGNRECYTNEAHKGDEIFGNWEILTEGPYDPIHVTVESPGKQKLYTGSNKAEDTFSFEADVDGDYELCIQNGLNGPEDGIARKVGFSFRTDVLVDEDIASEDSIRRLIELGNQLTKGLTNVLDHQSYMRQREDLHASTMESISSRVLIWTVVEALVLVGVAVWQVAYISKFFEVKRMI